MICYDDFMRYSLAIGGEKGWNSSVESSVTLDFNPEAKL